MRRVQHIGQREARMFHSHVRVVVQKVRVDEFGEFLKCLQGPNETFVLGNAQQMWFILVR